MTTEFAHQTRALKKGKRKKFFAYFMDPGTGKSYVSLKDGYDLYQQGDIDAMIILAPNSVKTSWVMWDHMKERPDDKDQVEQWLPAPNIIKGVWISSASGKDKKAWADFEKRIANRGPKLVILALNYEALLSEQFLAFLVAFCKEFRTLIIADESTRIGKMGSERTKRAIKLSKLCPYRRILTGTPIVKSPMKIFSQAKFLDESALSFKNQYSFRNRFCNMGGFKAKEIVSYKNLDELSDLIEGWSHRERKEDCLDLPPRLYVKRRVYMLPEQVRAYKSMREEFFAQIGDDEITAKIVLAQMTRLQQILGGYLNKDGKVIEIVPPSKNPKLQEALGIMKDAPGQVVVWTRFKPELAGLASLLKPGTFFEFHGDVKEKDRPAIRHAFKNGDRQFLLGTESTGGIGINEFLVADQVIHVSSDYDTEKRIQADDRNHRIGSERHEKITYYDIVVPGTVDMAIQKVLRGDTQLSAKILRENWREWI